MLVVVVAAAVIWVVNLFSSNVEGRVVVGVGVVGVIGVVVVVVVVVVVIIVEAAVVELIVLKAVFLQQTTGRIHRIQKFRLY